MTQHARPNLKAKFESGDSPSHVDFGDLIDSSANLLDTNAQVFAGRLEVSSLSTTNPVSADNIHYNSISIGGSGMIDAKTIHSTFIRSSALRHKNHHLLAYGSGVRIQTGTSGGVVGGASILAPGGFVAGGGGTVFSFGIDLSPIFYLANVTAVMHVKYTVMIDSDLAGTYTMLAYDTPNLNMVVPESRCTMTITPGMYSCFSGQFMNTMATDTNDRFDLRLINSAATAPYSFTVGSYNLSILPVSYRSF